MPGIPLAETEELLMMMKPVRILPKILRETLPDAGKSDHDNNPVQNTRRIRISNRVGDNSHPDIGDIETGAGRRRKF